VVVILASLAFGFVVWWGSRGGYARQPSESVVDCQDRYQQAATFRDTAAIDLSYPTAYWQHTSSRRGPQTCGDLRITGRLR
jgi:hypothetical protein